MKETTGLSALTLFEAYQKAQSRARRAREKRGDTCGIAVCTDLYALEYQMYDRQAWVFEMKLRLALGAHLEAADICYKCGYRHRRDGDKCAGRRVRPHEFYYGLLQRGGGSMTRDYSIVPLNISKYADLATFDEFEAREAGWPEALITDAIHEIWRREVAVGLQ